LKGILSKLILIIYYWRKIMRTFKTIIYALFFTMLGILLTAKFDFSDSVDAKERSYKIVEPDTEQVHSRFAVIAKESMNSLVHIKVSRSVEYRYQSPFDKMFEGMKPFYRGDRGNRSKAKPKTRTYLQKSEGSGFIYTTDGYIMTNNHVVEKSDNITVIMHDGTELEGELIGNDPETDLAIIKIYKTFDKSDVATLGNSENLWVGDWVIAIGSPYSLEKTLTVGVVSAKGRSGLGISGGAGPIFQDFIQTDAAINPGNSGGPLLDVKGRVVGINAAVNSVAQGIGFAIPVDLAKRVEKQLREKGQVKRGYVGIGLKEISNTEKEPFGLDMDATGILITSVSEGTPAEESGLKPYDIIVKLNGIKLNGFEKFRFDIASFAPGDDVEITILRDGDQKDISIELGDRSEFTGRGSEVKKDSEKYGWMGLKVKELTQAEKSSLKFEGGLIITEIKEDSKVEGKLQAGDIIYQMWSGGKAYKLESMDDFEKIGNDFESSKRAILINFMRNRVKDTVVIK
jgi:serine protease Do